jgi:hypothetical protein
VPPGAADAGGLFEDADIVDTSLSQFDRCADATKAGPQDKDIQYRLVNVALSMFGSAAVTPSSIWLPVSSAHSINGKFTLATSAAGVKLAVTGTGG